MEFATKNDYENNIKYKDNYHSSSYNDIEKNDTKHDDNIELKKEWESASEPIVVSAKELKASVFDVASYILKKIGETSTMKLQKLVYYCQAWSLVWDENPLFEEKIEAWANGPVVRDLFFFHQGMFKISYVAIGNPNLLNEEQKETIDAIIKYYGDKKAQWLIDLTHSEEPWKQARADLPISVRSDKEISLESMAEYYSSLHPL